MLAAHVRRTATGRARPGAAAGVLRRQRRLPLPGPVAGRAAVGPAGRVRGGVAAGGKRGGGVRALAAAVAADPRAEPGRPPHAAGPGRGAGRDEHGVLPGGGPAPAVHGRRDRVPRHRDPGRRRGTNPAQRRGPPPHHGGRGGHHGDPRHRAAARVRLRLRELRAVHAVHRARPPDRQRGRPGRDRPPGGGHARRGGGRYAVGPGRRAARVRPSGAAAGRGGGRRVLVGDSLRHRPAGHGPAGPGHVLPHAGPAAGVRHRHRRDRAAPAPYRPGRRRDHPGSTRRRPAQGTTKGITVDYVRLGSAGLTVSRICLGMMSYGSQAERAWHLDEAAAEPIVKAAVDGGITYFDTADTYSDGVSEQITGRLLGRLFDHRDDYVLATKVFFPMGPGRNDRGLSRKHILAAIDASLRRLGTDYVDLYQIHRWDYESPIEETMEALHDVVKAGKARYIGASSMFAWQFAKAQHVAERNGWTRFVSMQNHYNLLYREEEREMLPLCADQGVAVLPYSPLARGMLTGNRNRQGEHLTARAGDDPLSADRYSADADFDVVDRLVQVAAERGAPPAQVALAWLLGRPGVTAPIVGATKLGHISDALAAVQLTLSGEETARLEELYVPHPVLAHS